MWREKFSTYSLHESVIRKIECRDQKLIFVFCQNQGYSLFNREQGRLDPPMHNSVIEFYMKGVTSSKADQYLLLMLLKKRKVKYIDFQTLCKMMKRDEIRVNTEYITYLDESILISGYIGRYQLFCKLYGIEEVFFLTQE